jgi:uncharacterized protein (TIGR02145 family)
MKPKIVAILAALLLPFVSLAQSGALFIDELEWADANVAALGAFASRPDVYTEHYRFGVLTACPAGWRLPTAEELKALNASGSTNAAVGARGNQVRGRFYGPNHATASLPDNMEGAIFLPSSGLRDGRQGRLINVHNAGYYWSSTASGHAAGYSLEFHTSPRKTWSRIADFFDRSVAMNLRCVHTPPTGCVVVAGGFSGSSSWSFEAVPAPFTGCVSAEGNYDGGSSWTFESVPTPFTGCVSAEGSYSGSSRWTFEAVPTPLMGCVSADGNYDGSNSWAFEAVP